MILVCVLSCNKDNTQDKCEDCVIKTYECEKEGGEIRWKTNGEQEVVSSGYFYANQGGINETQQVFNFAGNLYLCSADFEGSTRLSTKKFGVGVFSYYTASVEIKDFCGERASVSASSFTSSSDYIEITKFDGKKADGKFFISQITGGATQCKPDRWMVEGMFKEIPVY